MPKNCSKLFFSLFLRNFWKILLSQFIIFLFETFLNRFQLLVSPLKALEKTLYIFEKLGFKFKSLYKLINKTKFNMQWRHLYSFRIDNCFPFNIEFSHFVIGMAANVFDGTEQHHSYYSIGRDNRSIKNTHPALQFKNTAS